MTTSHGIKLDEKTRARLKVLAEKRDRSAHWLMVTAIEKYLDSEERYEFEKNEDMARWEYYLNTGKSIDNNEVVDWLKDLAKNRDAPCPQ